MSVITFHTEEIKFVPRNKNRIRLWLQMVALQHGKSVEEITFVFCSDEKLLTMNQQYLKHDEFTDIITFDYSTASHLSGDIFISVDRVKENALEMGIPFETEMKRVMVHGVLHLAGFKDKSPGDKKQMREKENEALEMWKS